MNKAKLVDMRTRAKPNSPEYYMQKLFSFGCLDDVTQAEKNDVFNLLKGLTFV
jgi:hypothetical protein